MTTSTFLAMSTGAMIAIIFGMGIPLFQILFVLRSKKKNPVIRAHEQGGWAERQRELGSR